MNGLGSRLLGHIMKMYPGRWGRSIVLILSLAAVGQGVTNLVSYAIVSVSRIREPDPIQWLEPLFLRNALQFYHGEPLYPPPSLDYVGSMYTPGYDIINGLLLHTFGLGYEHLRLVAFGFFVGLAILIGVWVFRETRDVLWAIIISICVISIDPPLNYWFSSVNVDAGYLLLTFSSFFLVYFKAYSRRAIFVAGALAAGSFVFKQQGFLGACAVFLCLVLTDIRQGLRFAIACAAVAGSVGLYYLITSDGWFWTASVSIPLTVPSKASVQFYHSLMQLSPIAVMMLMALLPWFLLRPANGSARGLRSFWLLVAVAIICLSWLSFRKVGGGANSLAPILLLGFLVGGLARGLLTGGDLPPWVRLGFNVSLLVMCLVVMVFGMEGVRPLASRLQVPGPEVRTWNTLHPSHERFERLVEEAVETHSGPVFVGGRFLALAKRGKPLNTHQTPLYNGTRRSSYYDIDDITSHALSARKYSAIILWEYPDSDLLPLVKKHYEKEKDLGIDPLIGLRVSVWRPSRRTAPLSAIFEKRNLLEAPPPCTKRYMVSSLGPASAPESGLKPPQAPHPAKRTGVSPRRLPVRGVCGGGAGLAPPGSLITPPPPRPPAA